MNNLASNASHFAQIAHNGQFRRDGVTPYIAHPRDVVVRLKKLFPDAGDELLAIGYLHDVIEDTEFDAASLEIEGFPNSVIGAVEVLTKTKDTPYMIYMFRVRSHPLARKVKIADILSNLADNPTEPQVAKYAKALSFLYS